MWNLFRRHCSDERLLAHADGELPLWRSAWVKRHLNLCWDCRTRLHELEAQTQLLAKTVREEMLLSADRIVRARARLIEGQRAFEKAPGVRVRSAAHGSFALRKAVLAAACLALIFTGGWLRMDRAENAGDLLARTASLEAELYRTPLLIHQTFQVRMRRIQPEPQERSGQIEIWSDPNGRRFSSRWRNSDGELRHAAWRSDAGKEYLYNAASSPGQVVVRSAATQQARSLGELPASSLDLETLETSVIQWIETRQWRPISLSADLNTFAGQDGAMLRAERDGARLCLQAERVRESVRVEFALELDPASRQPRLQRIRFESPEGVLEVELAAGQCEFVSLSRLRPNAFEPELPLIAVRAPGAPRPPEMAQAEPEMRSRSAASLLELEMKARYVLHRARACLGEPVEIAVAAGRASPYLEIRGLVETEERRQELQSAMAELDSVRVSLRTTEEAVRQTAASINETPPGARFDLPLQLSNGRPPAQDRMEAFFAGKREDSAMPASQRIAQLSTQAISLSQGTLSHAWALRRLVERYGEGQETALLSQSRWLLEVMIRDHVAALDSGNRRMRDLLEPVLDNGPAAAEAAQEAVSEPTRSAADWRRSGPELFATASEIDRLVRGLFAGAGLPERTSLSGAQSVERSAQDLIDAFQRLERQCRSLPAGAASY